MNSAVMMRKSLSKALFAGIILMALWIGTSRAASPAAVAAGKAIREKFVEAVQNPLELQNMLTTQEVEVLFTVRDDGSIEIRKIEGTDEDATNFVREKLLNTPCREYVYPNNQYYQVKFLFLPG